MAASNALPLDGSVVKMKGLPFKASPEDIIKFFQGFVLKPENVYLKRHPDGRPNGEAFIVFESSDEARRATQKDRETFGDKFGDRYVRVYPTLESDVSDMQQAVLQQSVVHQQGPGHGHGPSDSVVKIKSLPFDANQLDIIQFFETFKLKPNGVQLVVRSDNKPTGEAFVDFENSEEAARAIREKDHKVFSEKFGDRYVRLIQVSRKEMQATLALRFGGEGILKMKGIPFKATAADVRKFFSNYKIKPEGISFIMHADGRPTGMAFIEFETPQEAVRAMEKDRAKFGPEYGDRFCMLQLVGRHEMDKVSLQKEGETNNATKLLNGINGIQNNLVMQAAAIQAATQAALNNPALQPMLLGASPWLNPALQFGLVNPASAAALANQMGQQMPAAGGNNTSAAPMLDATLAAQLSSQLNITPSAPMDSSATNPLLYYQNQDWSRAAAEGRLGLGGLNGTQLPHASAAAPELAPIPSTDLPQPGQPVVPLGIPVQNPMVPKVPLPGQQNLMNALAKGATLPAAANGLPYMNGRPVAPGHMPLSMPPLGMPVIDGMMNASAAS